MSDLPYLFKYAMIFFWMWGFPLIVVGLLGVLPLLSLFTRGRFRQGVRKLTLIYYVACLSVVGFVVALKRPILQGEIFPGLSGYLYSAFAPSNLNTPLYDSKVSLESTDFEFGFYNKYPGFYKLELHFASKVPQKLVGDLLRTEEEIGVYFQLRDGDKIIREESTVIHESSYWSQLGSGMMIYYYRAPDDLEYNKTYHVTVRIDGDIDKLIEKYGPVTLKLKRDHEKFRPTFEVPLFNL